ncbi:hypothetical protein MSG28_005167 [Choristoneura fumiferana]|uniref:Uncharacterized protein n=1 Tax=Choristoneura fumiferana TaxID=7141 RepID=A0ACC0JQD5_CHOFU|nr:hypothetical protein MSG28_005167 [Choristoneura fumiferana]
MGVRVGPSSGRPAVVTGGQPPRRSEGVPTTRRRSPNATEPYQYLCSAPIHVWPLDKLGPIMGCTSSAPSMAPANATEKNITFSNDTEEKVMDEINEMVGGVTQTRAIIENKVLPTCDTLDETIITKADKSILDTASHQRIDKDVQTDSFRIDNGNAWNESFKVLQEENTPKVDEVVEKAIEMSNSDTAECAQDSPEDLIEVATDMDKEEINGDYEHLEGAISPSQSESSRATRWEALADIAAELPPSLAVDPLTGQIYSLSK